MNQPLETEFSFFLENRDLLFKEHANRFIVIKGREVLGDYDNEVVAIAETVKQGHKMGTFLVQLCSGERGSYTETYHSRAYFK